MDQKTISNAVIKRLPRYYRYLGELLADGCERISSGDLSERMKVTASQIRQDLNNFGGFGQQGYGYNVQYLHSEIGRILGLDRTHSMIIVGSGNLGQALANYASFESSGFKTIAMFDIKEELKGTKIRDVEIHMMDELPEFVRNNKVDIAALTLPKTEAMKIADILVRSGIRGIWNFAHTDLNLSVPEDVVVENVHLSESLMRLSYVLESKVRDDD